MLGFCCSLAALVLSLGSLVPAAPARADGSPDRLASLTISIWLEYDRPGALYIYRGELPAGTPLPARLQFRLPAQPSSTAGVDADGKFRYIQPDVKPDGNGVLAGWSTSWLQFQLECYADTLQKQGAARQLDLTYKAEYPIEQLVLVIKEPYGALDFVTQPAAETQSQAEDGLTEHRRVIGPIAPGQEVHWQVTYTKNDPRLASEALGLPTPAASAYEGSATTALPSSRRNLGLWALIGLAGFFAFGGLALAWRPHARPAEATAPSGEAEPEGAGRAVGRGKANDRTTAPAVRVARFCHQCGAAQVKGDAFCRRCGARRRGT